MKKNRGRKGKITKGRVCPITGGVRNAPHPGIRRKETSKITGAIQSKKNRILKINPKASKTVKTVSNYQVGERRTKTITRKCKLPNQM